MFQCSLVEAYLELYISLCILIQIIVLSLYVLTTLTFTDHRFVHHLLQAFHIGRLLQLDACPEAAKQGGRAHHLPRQPMDRHRKCSSATEKTPWRFFSDRHKQVGIGLRFLAVCPLYIYMHVFKF